jgi:hypothetical protein
MLKEKVKGEWSWRVVKHTARLARPPHSGVTDTLISLRYLRDILLISKCPRILYMLEGHLVKWKTMRGSVFLQGQRSADLRSESRRTGEQVSR